MKSAITAAVVAAIVASGTTYAATQIDGHSIRRNSIPANRLTNTAVKRLHPSPRLLAAAVTSTIVQESNTVSILGVPGATVDAQCPTGDTAVGGGYSAFDVVSISVEKSSATPDGSAWEIVIARPNGPNADSTLTAYASCEPSS